MSYQVLARKWRPQRFDEVVGQQAVTRTLTNALASGRLAQAFIFAGPRGVGKTTTARILARALNCVNGPTADPCGVCEACVEIAQGRDMDVLEIDAATHTGVDNVREVIIENLAVAPARDRYKIYVIDEVHQLSPSSFNALLKSLEEPPPHVVFMMATTELAKIPDTIQSRSQVFEFRTITGAQIAAQLRRIADAEGITIADDAIALVARAAEGSMRDAQSALDQVIAFAGTTVTAEDAATVLGLVGRDLLLDVLEAVADENVAAAFALAARADETGYDLRGLCKELARTVRDLMLVSIDPSRLSDPDVAGEGDRDRVEALATRFSREDLLRSFDLLARTEQEIRASAQPRYHLEMALLKWIHLRRLVPMGDLLASLEPGPGALASGGGRPGGGGGTSRPAPAAPPRPSFASGRAPARPAPPRSTAPAPAPPRSAAPASAPAAAPAGDLAPDFKDRFLAEIQRAHRTLYSLHVAQAQRIEVEGRKVTFTFGPAHEAMRQQIEGRRAALEALAAEVAGGRVTVATARGGAGDPPAPPRPIPEPADAPPPPPTDLKARALADGAVQAMLEVFPAEIRDVEEIP